MFSLADMGLSPGEMASTLGNTLGNVGKAGMSIASFLAAPNPVSLAQGLLAGKGIFDTFNKSTETLLSHMEETGAIPAMSEQDTGKALANDFSAIEAAQDFDATSGIPAGEAIDAGNIGMGVAGPGNAAAVAAEAGSWSDSFGAFGEGGISGDVGDGSFGDDSGAGSGFGDGDGGGGGGGGK